MTTKLGKLESFPLQKCFPHEALDFTPWLAEAQNLEELARTLDMELELEGVEVPVGPYRADIVATDTGNRVVIENQYGKTNHDHLGKTLTYAAGLQAKAVIWIAETFSDEHRRTFDFLNEVTTEDFRLYAIEMKLFRIGDSPPAPQFQVVARPNEYLRSVTTGGGSGDGLTETQKTYLKFWTRWREHLAGRKTSIRPLKPMPQHWALMGIGRSHFGLSLTASIQKRRLGCEIYIDGAHANKAFGLLRADQDAIEKVTGPLVWMPLKGKQTCRIVQFKGDVDVASDATWPDAHAWLLDRAETLRKAFKRRIKALDLSVPIEVEVEEEAEEEA